ncbi:MAG: right-handed parallel beta-helix repeat-containing protein [Rhodothermales bacterium]|nr:right-handed parallel beta-helix repeat-containing protein [Rhodothermales bacterium]
MRPRLWDQNYENNVTIEGLVFEHAATPWDPADAAVWISGSRNVSVVQCEIRNTNWQGLYVGESSDVEIHSTVMNHNGGQGWGLFRVKRLEAIGNETSFNNWRGELGGFNGWSVGNKLLSVHQALILRHRAIGNFSRGLWLDYDIRETVLDSVLLSENARDGLWIEASQGPITVKNSVITDNLEGGIRSTYSRWVVVDSNRIAGNKQGQILLDGTGRRHVRDYETGESMYLTLRNWTVTHNEIQGDVAFKTARVFKRSDWRQFARHLLSDKNRYARSDRPVVFDIVKGRWSFAEWKENTGQDTRSTAGS